IADQGLEPWLSHAYDVLPITLICKPFHIQPESLLLARSPMNCLRFISHKIIPNNCHYSSLSRLLNLYSTFFLFSGQWLDHSPFFIHLRYESTTFHGLWCRRCVHHLSCCDFGTGESGSSSDKGPPSRHHLTNLTVPKRVSGNEPL